MTATVTVKQVNTPSRDGAHHREQGLASVRVFCYCGQVLDQHVTISKAASTYSLLITGTVSHHFLLRCPYYFKASLPLAGAEEELGRGAQRVPVPLGVHRFHPEEDSQAEAGRRDEAAGA